MAHETGSASSPVDLLDKLRVFCLAQGFTVDEYIDFQASPGKLLSVNFNGGFYSIYFDPKTDVDNNGFYLSQATDFTPATNPWDRTDATDQSRCFVDVNEARTIGTYHFTFHVGGVVMVSFLTDVSVWRHFCFGDIEKYGTWTGGSYIQGHAIQQSSLSFIDDPYHASKRYFGAVKNDFNTFLNSTGWIRVDEGATVKMRALVRGTNTIANSKYMESNLVEEWAEFNPIFQTSPSAPTQASSLTPLKFAVPIALDSAKHSPIGFLRDVRFCNIQHLDNEQIFDTDWLVFSMGVKKDPDVRDDLENTGYLGLAVRVI